MVEHSLSQILPRRPGQCWILNSQVFTCTPGLLNADKQKDNWACLGEKRGVCRKFGENILQSSCWMRTPLDFPNTENQGLRRYPDACLWSLYGFLSLSLTLIHFPSQVGNKAPGIDQISPLTVPATRKLWVWTFHRDADLPSWCQISWAHIEAITLGSPPWLPTRLHVNQSLT